MNEAIASRVMFCEGQYWVALQPSVTFCAAR